MSPRRIHRKDSSSDEIVKAIRAAGWLVYYVGTPCDVFCFKAGVWRALELKSPYTASGAPRKRKDQGKQDEFLRLTGTPRVTTPIKALQALGDIS